MRRILALVFAGALVAACGADQKEAAPAAAPSAKSEPEPQTVEEAQAQLDRARADLDRSGAVTGISPTTSTPQAGTTPTTPGTAAGAGGDTGATHPAPTQPARPPADMNTPESDTTRPPSPCEQACRALSSMKRAKEAICRLAGATDAKCTQAEKTLHESEARVTQCACH